MRITLTGGSGFIGSSLTGMLESQGHRLRHLSRHAKESPCHQAWDPVSEPPPAEPFLDCDAVIHLAGEPVAQRWTSEAKRRIHDSRVYGTRNLVRTLASLDNRPRVLVAASAVGYYGSRGEELLTEASSPGSGFLAETCVEWEAASQSAAELGVRVVQLRIGVVLGPGGGALARMLPPFRAGLGGPLAGGRQWMPWIHREDLCRMILFAIEEESLSGPVNAVAHNPVTNADFTAALSAALRRPAFFPVPAISLRILYGEMAEVILGSQRVVPEKLKALDFRFSFPVISAALKAVIDPP